MLQFKWRYLVVTGLYCGLIFYLSSQPEPPKPPFSFTGVDKVGHAVVYAGLALLVSFGILRSNEAPPPSALFFVPLAFAALYGLMDEIHQIFVPRRTFELLDWLSDGAGSVVAQVAIHAASRRSRKVETMRPKTSRKPCRDFEN